MCGICGILEKSPDPDLAQRMCDVLAHRGPDHAGIYTSGDVCLGHRRLSIIDLDTGDQPIFNADKTLAIVFNGEIYNYRELRHDLLQQGCTFQTKSDTEVVLKLYEIHGVAAFQKLNGIFAFAILDERENEAKLVLARDHFGIKPLHYYARDNLFLFASEYKAILLHPNVSRDLNIQALHHQMNLRYNQTQETLIKNIFRLPPAHFMIVKNQQIERCERYYQIQPNINYNKSEKEWLEEIPHYVQQAVKRQLVADVPLGVYLSGGMDSGSIVAMMRHSGVEDVRTFTLGFNEPTDEIDDAQQTVNRYQTNHHILRMDLNPMRRLPQVIWHAEEPKINLLQGFLMSGFVSQHVKVALGGLGGDELFSGYDIHKLMAPFNAVHRLVPSTCEEGIGSLLSRAAYRLQSRLPKKFDEYRRALQAALASGNVEKMYLILRNVWDYDQPHLQQIYAGSFPVHELQPVHQEFDSLFQPHEGMTALDQVYLAEFQSKMVNDYLLVEDRMSMANSLEERVPFLDLDLVNFGFTIPARMKMQHGQTKYLLRKAMASFLPERIRKKKKWGFTFNPYLQFQKDLKQTAEQILTREKINADGIFNYNYIRSILDAAPHPKMRWHYNYIWVLTGFYIWKQMYLDAPESAPSFELENYFT